MEIWKDVTGYEGLYLVSSYGRVKSVKSGLILKPTQKNCGGLQLKLSKNGKSKGFQISRLVAIAFIPNPEGKPCVDHIDGVRFHNFVENLRWCTYDENMNYELAIANKTRYTDKIQGLGYDGKVVVEFANYKEAVQKGFNRSLIKKEYRHGEAIQRNLLQISKIKENSFGS